jgi:diguanylate cyclase
VSLTAGLPVATLACVAAAALGVVLLARNSVRAGPAVRSAYHRICFGIGVGTVGFACTSLAADGGWRVDTPARLAPAAAGVTVGTVLLVVGLLTLPAAAGDCAAAVRHALDGALIASYALLIGWTLAVQPAIGHVPVGDARTFVLGIPLVVVVTAVGIAVVAAGRSPRPVLFPAAAVGG